MPGREIDIYTIQDPDSIKSGDERHSKEDLQGQLTNLQRHYRNKGVHTIYVKDIHDFVRQVQAQTQNKGVKIRNLIIAAHGFPGFVYIGKNPVNGDDRELAILRKLAPSFARDANVYLLSCRTGQKDELLKKFSRAFGGVNVHGYTGFITTTDYWFKVNLDDGTEEGGKHVVCFRNRCEESKRSLPYPAPRVKTEQEKKDERFERSSRRI